MFILILSVLFSFSQDSLAESHQINFFPESDSFFLTTIEYQKHSVIQKSSESNTRVDKHIIFENSYARKLDDLSYIKISLPYIHSELNERDNGAAVLESYSASGFREPKVSYSQRLSTTSGIGETIKDMSFSITPALTQRKVGTDESNSAIGGSQFDIHGSFGAYYVNWEARIYGEMSYQMEKDEKNLDNGSIYIYSPVTTFLIGIEFQYTLNSNWFLRGGTGLKINQTYDIKDKDSGYISTVQQATGSEAYLGSVYKQKNDIYFINLRREKNDFFTENSDNPNTRGDSRQLAFEFSYLKLF